MLHSNLSKQINLISKPLRWWMLRLHLLNPSRLTALPLAPRTTSKEKCRASWSSGWEIRINLRHHQLHMEPCRRRNQKYSSVELNDQIPGALHAIPCHPQAHSKRGISPLCTPANVHILIWAWSNVYNWNVTSLCIPANMDLVNLALCTNIPLTCTYEIYPPSRHIDLNLS